MTHVELHPTSCAICGTPDNSQELYPANFDTEAFSAPVFSARRLPDRLHYRMVRCNSCGLVRSDPAGDPDLIAQLYRQSTFDYGSEIDNIGRTYRDYLARLDNYGVRKDTLLEVGCGNGFFLQYAAQHGYRNVYGVEPSRHAVEQAPPELRQAIVCDIMRPGLFPTASLDVICFFQVLDHLFDPAEILRVCHEALKPGGFALCLNHDIGALSARVLKHRSPIIDIEHTYLYDPNTISALFSRAGFDVVETGKALNRYSLNYLVRLLPLPNAVKRGCISILEFIRLDSVPLRVSLGNLYIIARKSTSREPRG